MALNGLTNLAIKQIYSIHIQSLQNYRTNKDGERLNNSMIFVEKNLNVLQLMRISIY